MFYVLKCILFLLASFLKCFLSFKLNFLYASGFPAKKPPSLISEFFDLIFILNFVYASHCLGGAHCWCVMLYVVCFT